MTTDINQLGMNDVQVVERPVGSAEEFFRAPLIDDGANLVTLALGNRGLKFDRVKKGAHQGEGFFNAHLQLKRVKDNGDEGGTIGFDNLTDIPLDSGWSKLAALIELAGFEYPWGAMQPGERKEKLEAIFAQSPRVEAVTQWQAQEKVGTEYVDVLKGQKNFPFDTDTGKYSPEVVNPKTGNTVTAQVKVVSYRKAR